MRQIFGVQICKTFQLYKRAGPIITGPSQIPPIGGKKARVTYIVCGKVQGESFRKDPQKQVGYFQQGIDVKGGKKSRSNLSTVKIISFSANLYSNPLPLCEAGPNLAPVHAGAGAWGCGGRRPRGGWQRREGPANPPAGGRLCVYISRTQTHPKDGAGLPIRLTVCGIQIASKIL